MPAHPDPPAPGGPHILLVEDDGITARYLRNCLLAAGYPPPSMASSAHEAVASARAERPDLVLMDIMLLGAMDGIDAAARILEHTTAPVVFLTARGDVETWGRAVTSGAAGFLVKPVLARELCSAVSHALSRRSGEPVGRPLPEYSPHPTAPPLRHDPRVVHGAYEELRALTGELQRQIDALLSAQQRLEAERRHYRSLFDLAPDGYLITDSTGVILEANQGAGDLLGVAPAQMTSMPLSVFIPHGDHRAYYDQLGHLTHDTRRRQWETPLRPRHGRPFRASLTILAVPGERGQPAEVRWTIRDIGTLVAVEQALHEAQANLQAVVREGAAELARVQAALRAEVAERHRVEASLRESREFLQGMAEAAPCMLYAYDLTERRTVYAGAHVEAYLGYPQEALSGLVLEDCIHLIHPTDRGAARRHLERVHRAADGEVVESTLRVRHGDESWRWLRIRDVISTRDAGGAPARCVGAAEDITELREALTALVRAEKLADTGRMAASLAHEINNPLQGVLGCLGLLDETLMEGRDPSRYLQVAMRELRRAVRVVGQLRDLGRQAGAPAERAATDLAALVSQVMAVTEKRSTDQHVQVTWESLTPLPPVFADHDAIQQVILNLVLNALDAMPNGGALRLDAAATTAPDGVRMRVADDGPGIDPDVVPKLFGSFVTTKPEGLGLGLYISRNIVEQHGGRIDVETAPGSGTTFTVWLPVATPGSQ